MTFWETYFFGLLLILALMTTLWIFSGILRNASIVDSFWGPGFVLAGFSYFVQSGGLPERKMLVISLLFIWGIRLAMYITWRNWGKGEDFRYQQFREDYGTRGYWWYSFRQVFLLQGFLMWVISAPTLAAQYYGKEFSLGWLDLLAVICWALGFALETLADYQMIKFKARPLNRDKVMNQGLWKYSRHPNYFGDALIWWGFGLFALAAGNYYSLIGPVLMTYLLVRVSGVVLLEETLVETKIGYRDYVEKTSAFFPWFPKK